MCYHWDQYNLSWCSFLFSLGCLIQINIISRCMIRSPKTAFCHTPMICLFLFIFLGLSIIIILPLLLIYVVTTMRMITIFFFIIITKTITAIVIAMMIIIITMVMITTTIQIWITTTLIILITLLCNSICLKNWFWSSRVEYFFLLECFLGCFCVADGKCYSF